MTIVTLLLHSSNDQVNFLEPLREGARRTSMVRKPGRLAIHSSRILSGFVTYASCAKGIDSFKFGQVPTRRSL